LRQVRRYHSQPKFHSASHSASAFCRVISYYYKVSSESGYDYLSFYIDSVLQNQWSGEVAWAQSTSSVTAGLHTFKWVYAEDSYISSGSDCGWVDNIVFPAGSTAPLYPPQNLAATSGNGYVNLTWQAPAFGTPTGYKVYRNSTLITTTPITGLLIRITAWSMRRATAIM